MLQNKLSGKKERAAALLADDSLSDEEIAARVGVSRMTLVRWKRESDFSARVAEIVSATREAALEKTIAARARRIDFLIDRHERMQRVILERASYYQRINEAARASTTSLDMASDIGAHLPSAEAAGSAASDDSGKPLDLVLRHAFVPGAETGLLVHEEKISKYGSIDTYKVDTALLREMRETERQMAIERGEWQEKDGSMTLILPTEIASKIDRIYGDPKESSPTGEQS